MPRYNDTDKLIEEIKERIKAAIEWGKSAETEEIKIRAEQAVATFCEASLTAKKLSTADVVEVVRCKDCKYYVLHTLFGHTQGWCERLCDEFDRSLAHGTEVDDYCSKGERADI